MSKDVVLVLKLTDQCNINCTYCYFYAGTASTLRANKQRDIANKLRAFVETANNSHVLREANTILLVLHGGEPLLVPPQIIGEFLRSLKESFANIFVSLQTNGTLINEEWIALFIEHSISVGLSLDGPPDINDKYRVGPKGEGTSTKAVEGLKLVLNAAAMGKLARPGVLSVFQPNVSADTYIQYFIDVLGVSGFDILFPDDVDDRFGSVEPIADM